VNAGRPAPRVLLLSDSTTLSGAEVVLLGHVDRLRELGGMAHVFLAAENTRLQTALDLRGVPSTRCDRFSSTPLRTTANPIELVRFAVSLSSVARLLSDLVRRERPDLIHSVSYPASLYAALACRATGIGQIWHEHNIKRLHRFNRPIYRWVASTCHHVIGPSDAVTSNLRLAIPPEKATTVYNGIDLARFRIDDGRAAAVRRELNIPEGTPAVGLFGQMLPYKGHETLIRAAPTILEAVPATRFFFVGALENPPYEAQLRAALANRSLADRFELTGWRQDVADVMRAMDVIVVATTTPEPAALSLMEAMAMGRPVVASRTGGTPEIVVDGETGVLVPPGDPVALAAATSRLLLDPAASRALGEAGRRRVEQHFTIERHLDRIVGLYASVTERPPGADGVSESRGQP
jgi:glycosyltransferase involved in cell wall biosynthesis